MSEVRQALPEDLEIMPPGPELASLLASFDREALSGKDRLRLAQARNRLVSHTQAQLMADLYAVTREEPAEDRAVPEQCSRYPWAETEVAFAMRWTRAAAGGRLEQARQLIEDLPQVHDALSTGEIDMPKALVISELTSWLDDEHREAVPRVVDKVIDKAPQWTTGQLRARLRRLILAIDPEAARKRCATAIKTRRVEMFDNPEGTAELWGRHLPPQDAAAAWERLTAIARAAKTNGDTRSMAQLRADALLDLLVGEGIAVGEPLSPHTGGLAEAAGLPTPEQAIAAGEPLTPDPATSLIPTSTQPATDPGPEPTAPMARPTSADEPAAQTAAQPVTVPDGWDPAWPLAPDDRIGPQHVGPDPDGEPADPADIAGQAFDGRRWWPVDWPGRWLDDPAVAASGGGHNPLGLPTTPTGNGHNAGNRSRATCQHCGHPVELLTPRRGVVELSVPLTTAIGIDDLPAELNGYGPVVADIARQIIAAMPEAQWRFSAYSQLRELAVHGILHTRPDPQPEPGPEQGRERRRPTAEQAAFVRARDRTCIAPGCQRPARECDIDHTKAWVKGGLTEACNLECLCRGHHLFKHTTGCELHQLSSGVFVWQTPRGMQYLTKQDPPLADTLQM